ncbi:putative periplasmic solute-binding protein, partial [Thiovulum sp. ES]
TCFLQKHIRNSQFHLAMRSGVPRKVNSLFKDGKVDGAFISSILSENENCGNLGIIARKDVLSVLVLSGENIEDSESQTSNMLSKILRVDGKVLIGDKALIHYFQNRNGIDLAEKWNEKFGKPFVFAKLCYKKNLKTFKKIENKFLKTKTFIPHYIMEKEKKRLGLSRNEILFYLSKIDYFCDKKKQNGIEKVPC